MVLKGRSRIFGLALALLSFLALALWAGSATPSRFDFLEDLSLSNAPNLDDTFGGGAGGGVGSAGEIEWEQGWELEKQKLKEGGEGGELELDKEGGESSPEESVLSTHPLLAPVSSQQLTLIRKDYLRRLEAMEGFHPGATNATHNERMIKKLELCLREGDEGRGLCATEVPRVIIVTDFYFACALDHCSTTGEVIWMAPVAASLENLGHFTLNYEDGALVDVWDRLGGDLITMIWTSDQALLGCFSDKEDCIESEINPVGIPAWKIFALTFWGCEPGASWWGAPNVPWSFNPLGTEWILTPYRMPGNHTYLGYTHEGCTDVDVVPPSNRSDTVFVLGKYTEYFHRPNSWPLDLYPSLAEATGLQLITSAHKRDDEDPYELPAGLTSIGEVSTEEYSRMVGSAKVMLGIGRPGISPSPYAALCQGVPVVLPYWGPSSVPTGWDAFHALHQHAIAAQLGPPYVYSVDLLGPQEELIETVKNAVRTPIRRFVPPDMTPAALEARIRELVETDWREVARKKGWSEGGATVQLPMFLEKHADKGRFGRGKYQ